MAEGFGEAPVNLKACELTKNTNHCDEYHADDEAWWEDVYYWTTPDRGLRRRRWSRCARPRRTGKRPGRRSGASTPDRHGDDFGHRLRAAAPGRARGGGSPRSSTAIRAIRLGALLALPVAWLVVVYFGSLFVLLLSSFWETDPFTRERRPRVHARELPADHRDAGLPRRRVAHDPDGGSRDDRRRRARVPDRLLHGAGRVSADAQPPRRRSSSCRSGRTTS